MRILIMFSWLFFGVVALEMKASAETNESGETVHFLVDASGTMKGRVPDIRSVVGAKLVLLPKTNQFKVSFFGAAESMNGVPFTCGGDAPLTNPVKLASADFSVPEFGGDDSKTAIGRSLKKLLDSLEQPTHIVLITDGRDDCRSDYLAIREAYPTVRIEVEQVGLKRNPALELLEINPHTYVFSSYDAIVGNCEKCPEADGKRWRDASGGERFFWLASVFVLLAAAIVWAIRNLTVAGAFERRTEHLRHQKRKTNDGELTILELDEHQTITTSDVGPRKGAAIYFLAGCMGLLGFWLIYKLVFSAGGPGTLPFSDRDGDLSIARDMAWMVLGSPFAIAFSVLLSAPLLFAFSQYRRQLESKATYLTEVNAAGIAKIKRDNAKRKQRYSDYLSIRAQVLATVVAHPASWQGGFLRTPQHQSIFEKTVERAKILARKEELPADSSVEVIDDEITRLKQYTQNRLSYPFETYLELLKEDKLLKQPTWIDLEGQLQGDDAEQVLETLSKIASAPLPKPTE